LACVYPAHHVPHTVTSQPSVSRAKRPRCYTFPPFCPETILGASFEILRILSEDGWINQVQIRDSGDRFKDIIDKNDSALRLKQSQIIPRIWVRSESTIRS